MVGPIIDNRKADSTSTMESLRSPDDEVIKTFARPFSRTGGLAVLRGNLAPESAVTKPAAKGAIISVENIR